MEKNTKKETVCYCGCGDHNHHNPWWRLIKVFVGCFIILLVLLVGMAVGRRQALMAESWGYGPAVSMSAGSSAVMRQPVALSPNAMYMSTGSGNMTLSTQSSPTMLSRPDANVQRVAGVITDITGTAITILDNGGNSKTIYSTSTTEIYSGTSEIALTNLKAKEFIVSYVTTKNNQETAERIEVSQ